MVRFCCLILATILIPAPTLRAGAPSTRPAYEYHEEIRSDPPLHLHMVTVDLTNPAVHLKVSRGGTDPDLKPPWETTLMPVSEMAERDGLSVAVNGNFFAPKDYEWILGRKVFYFGGNWARACGWALSDGRLLSKTPLSPDWPTFIVSNTGHVAIGQFTRIPEGAGQAVSGEWQIVTDGKNSIPDNGPLAPRTAVGFDQSHHTLILLVIDGRRPHFSVGVTIHQLADEMIRLGAWEAINLDSGGSSTMVVRNKNGDPIVVNRPSDGHDLLIPLSIERNVADALGVVVDESQNVSAQSTSGN
jgi:hypothetical protein